MVGPQSYEKFLFMFIAGEGLADPTYKRVNETKRPSSVCSTGSNSNSAPLEQYPEYATVDKAKKAKNRKTVHVSGNLSLENLSTNQQGSQAIGKSMAVSSFDQLYAQVIKQDKKKDENPTKPAGTDTNTTADTLYDNQAFFSYQGTGARPKEFAKGPSNKNLGHRKSQSQSSAFVGNSSPRLRSSEVKVQDQHVENTEATSSSSLSHETSQLQMDNVDHINRNSPTMPVVVNQKDNLPSQGKVAPGYQTIGGLASLAVGEPMEDPDYDTVEDRAVLVTDHDPNYESLPGSATGLVLSAGSIPITMPVQPQQQSQQQEQVSNTNRVAENHPQPSASTSDGPTLPTAQEIVLNADGSSDIHMVHVDTHRSTTPWARREHIYQEIQDAKNENIYTPDPTHHPKRHKQSNTLATLQQDHMEQQQGNRVPRSNSPQYVTNL